MPHQAAPYVLEGQLDYDRELGDPADWDADGSDERLAPMSLDKNKKRSSSARKDHQIQITISYPSEKFGTDNNQFEKRHESMQADADEHYQLLVDMQVSDPVFDKMLLENHNRKRSVENILGKSRSWQQFIKHISPSMNY